MTSHNDNKRLDRIEVKIDGLQEAVISLARMEERMVTLFKRMDAYDQGQGKVTERVSRIEKIISRNGAFVTLLERIFWIVITATITAIVMQQM